MIKSEKRTWEVHPVELPTFLEIKKKKKAYIFCIGSEYSSIFALNFCNLTFNPSILGILNPNMWSDDDIHRSPLFQTQKSEFPNFDKYFSPKFQHFLNNEFTNTMIDDLKRYRFDHQTLETKKTEFYERETRTEQFLWEREREEEEEEEELGFLFLFFCEKRSKWWCLMDWRTWKNEEEKTKKKKEI